MLKPFVNVQTANPRRSKFNLSYSKLLTCDMGQIIPVQVDEVVPNDHFKMGMEAVVRMMPLVAPVLHEIDMFTYTFHVPYRILDEDFAESMTGGVDGASPSTFPRWEPTDTAIGSLWDYMGFPTGVDPDGAYPLDYPKRAYNLIYNEFFMDETLNTPVDITTSEDVLYATWKKDYFTSALLTQQRGTGPALPITGTSTAVFRNDLVKYSGDWPLGPSPGTCYIPFNANYAKLGGGASGADDAQSGANLKSVLDQNTVDLSSASPLDVADLRLVMQLQRFMERNNRCGVRYTEFINAHFGAGVAPRDERLQRPEFIGGTKNRIIVSEVLQTSATDPATSPQGTMAGHGISASQSYIGDYTVREFGLIMTLMVIKPKPMYQQGINRQWLRRTRYDFCFPEFINLSEQGIEQAELYATNTAADNIKIFGYQGQYDEMRYKPNMVCGLMRSAGSSGGFDYWHLGRKFTSAPELNDVFIDCKPDKRIFAVPSEPGFLVSFGNLINAIRPIPIIGEPGFMDHN